MAERKQQPPAGSQERFCPYTPVIMSEGEPEGKSPGGYLNLGNWGRLHLSGGNKYRIDGDVPAGLIKPKQGLGRRST